MKIRDNNRIAWHQNTDGHGTFGSEQVITNNAKYAVSVYASDFDGDGDMDVLSASANDDKIAWYENTDGLGNFGSQKIITTNMDASKIFAADIDGDGDIDVLFASYWDDQIGWYENTDGLGNFNTQKQIITSNAEKAQTVYATDIDGDGDMDVLSASSGDNKVAWYKNIDGLGNFGEQQIITTDAKNAISVHSADMDGDGDMDVLSASSDDNKIAWYENIDGQGTFGEQQIITINAERAVSVYAADINGDGNMDVLSASANDDKIAWYKQEGLCDGVTCAPGYICFEGSCYADCTENNNEACLDLGPNVVAGAGSSVVLTAHGNYNIFEWSTGETTQSILASTSGQYWVIAYDTNAEVYSTDTVNILIEANHAGECPDGYVNIDGYCFPPTDPCDGANCAEGYVCFEGSCFPDCSEELCDENSICYRGNCFVDAACENVMCGSGYICFEGGCYANCTENNNEACLDLGPNVVAGAGLSVVLTADGNYSIFEWSTGETTQSILASVSGQYWVIAYDTTALIYSTDTLNILIEANQEGECPDGYVNIDGYCFPPTDPCDGANCAEGYVCFEGSCFPDCSEELCDENSICYRGNCFIDALCENIICPGGMVCVEGACSSTVGIGGNNIGSKIKLYPNPTNGNVTIEPGDIADIKISVFSITGEKVYSVDNASEAKIVLPASSFPQGVYFVRIQSNKQQRIIKLVKQ